MVRRRGRIRILSPCKAEPNEVIGTVDAHSADIWVDGNAQHMLCSGTDRESLGVELGRRAEYKTGIEGRMKGGRPKRRGRVMGRR